MRSMVRCTLVCMLALSALAPNLGRADDAEDARAMFSVGLLALEQGDNTAAHAAFVRSLELHPTSAAAFNLAGVLTDLGRPTAAHALYEELARGVYGQLAPEQQADVTRLSAETEAASARIEVRVVAPGTVSVTIGEHEGVATEGVPFVQWVDPGAHTVRGTTAGARLVERQVDVRAGGLGRALLRFEFAAPTEPVAITADALTEPVNGESAQSQDEGRRISPWLWVVLGLVAAGGATVAIVLATRDTTSEVGTVLPATGTLLSF